ncbi:MAG: hypothetical protein ACJ78Q_02515 [Chloroflexia bacterium]
MDSEPLDDGPVDPQPRWLVVAGAVLLVGMTAVALFAIGVYMAERGLVR